MKRSRIFLGVTTALLAVAGIAAAKAHRLPVKPGYWFTKLNAAQTQGLCTRVKVTRCDINQPGNINCVAKVGTTPYQIYTQGSVTALATAVPCFTPVKYNIQ